MHAVRIRPVTLVGGVLKVGDSGPRLPAPAVSLLLPLQVLVILLLLFLLQVWLPLQLHLVS